MSSSIFFKFRSSKEPQRVEFDGTHLTVFELKREIINVSGLGDGTDFDLHIYDESNPDQEYDDDTTLIPRSSSVIARRVPAARPGYGRAARYVTGKAPVTAKNNSRAEQSRTASTAKSQQPPMAALVDTTKNMTEDERIAAFMVADGAQWEQQRQAMANAKPVYSKNPAHRKHLNSEKPIPPGYICHRCQQRGHWIQDCPTNDDPHFEPKPRLKRTTGIPKTFIKTVPKSSGADDGVDGATEGSQAGTVMLDAEGNQVVVVPDSETWKKFEQKHKATTVAQQDAASNLESKKLEERGLLCPIDNRLFVVPMKTPCCGKTYCNDCIENTLLDTDLTCPNCGESVLIDNLISDDDMVTKMQEYEREKADRERATKVEKALEKTTGEQSKANPTSEDATSGEAIDVKGQSPKTITSDKGSPKSPASAVGSPTSATGSNQGKNGAEATASHKRSAPDDSEGPSSPRPGQQAMQQQTQTQEQMFNQMMQGFPIPMQFNQFQPFGMPANMPIAFGMPPFNMQQQMPFDNNNSNNFMGGMGMGMGMGMMPNMNMNMMGMNMNMNMNPNMNPNMNMNMNTNWQQMPFHGGQPQQRYQQPQNNANQQRRPNNAAHNDGNGQQQQDESAQQDDSPYLRQPVNSRNQHRAKRVRPCDYTTLS